MHALKLTKSFLLAATLLAVTLSPSKAQLYIPNPDTNGGDIEEWDPTTGTELTSAQIFDSGTGEQELPVAVAISPDQSTIYVAASDDYAGNAFTTSAPGGYSEITISSFNVALDAITSNIVTIDSVAGAGGTAYATPNAIAISSDGSTLYVANAGWYDTEIQAINLSTGAVTNLTSINDTVEGLGFANGTLYASLYGAGTVETIDATTGDVLNSSFVTLPGPPGTGYNGTGGALTISGNNLYVDNWANQDVAVYNVTTGALDSSSFISTADFTNGSVGIATDGNTFYSANKWGDIYAFNASNGNALGDVAEGAGFSGQQIASLDDLAGGPVTPPIEDFPIAGSTPEPRSWTMALGVAGVVGFLLIRRRQSKAHAEEPLALA